MKILSELKQKSTIEDDQYQAYLFGKKYIDFLQRTMPYNSEKLKDLDEAIAAYERIHEIK